MALPVAFAVAISYVPGATANRLTCEHVFAQSGLASSIVDRTAPLIQQLAHEGSIEKVTLNLREEFRLTERGHERARELGNGVAGLLSAKSFSKEVRTVLYPAAGFDAGLPFRIFRDAEVVISLDNHPFVIEDLDGKFHPSHLPTARATGAWVYVGQMDEMGGMAEGIVDSILTQAPSTPANPIRILRTMAIRTNEMMDRSPTVHGLVDFDNGPGTPLRRYIHIQSWKWNSRAKLPSWVDALIQGGYDAVLSKSAMFFFAQYEESFGGYLLDHIHAHGGLLVDADAGPQLGAWPEELRNPARETRIKSNIRGLGYGSVHVTKFQKPLP